MPLLDTLRSVLRFERVETDPVERRLRRAASVDDLRRIANRRLPGGVFDYIDGGAEDERTLAANQAAFATTGFRPRVLRGLSGIDPSGTILGRPLPFPLVLAPTGFTRIADPEGELAVAARGRPRRHAVHAVDAQHPLHRGGRARSATGGSGSRCTRGATAGWSRR